LFLIVSRRETIRNKDEERGMLCVHGHDGQEDQVLWDAVVHWLFGRAADQGAVVRQRQVQAAACRLHQAAATQEEEKEVWLLLKRETHQWS
jgi:hypothetical protein